MYIYIIDTCVYLFLAGSTYTYGKKETVKEKCARLSISISVSMYIYSMYICICTFTYIYIYMHLHTHTHTYHMCDTSVSEVGAFSPTGKSLRVVRVCVRVVW